MSRERRGAAQATDRVPSGPREVLFVKRSYIVTHQCCRHKLVCAQSWILGVTPNSANNSYIVRIHSMHTCTSRRGPRSCHSVCHVDVGRAAQVTQQALLRLAILFHPILDHRRQAEKVPLHERTGHGELRKVASAVVVACRVSTRG